MAYRIRFHESPYFDATDLSTFGENTTRRLVGEAVYEIQQKIASNGFKVGSFDWPGYVCGRGPKGGSGRPGFDLELRQVRLTSAKPYCGNHPGECVAVGQRTKAGLKRASNCLEWDDWVRFHEVVNDVLDRLDISADITTAGADVDEGRFLFCRLGTKRRLRYDWVELSRNQCNATRKVNFGTPDQFEAET